jgi:hypothetical protein
VSYKREVIDVAVSRQVLWVGTEAYPLQNIARAQTLRLVPNRRVAVQHFAAAVVLEAVLGIAAAVALGLAPRLSSAPGYDTAHGVAAGALLLAVVLLFVSTFRLIAKLSGGTFYALLIETVGTPRSVLVSTNQRVVTGLVHQIMDTFDNPAATFHTEVENYVDLRSAQGVRIGPYSTQGSNIFNAR